MPYKKVPSIKSIQIKKDKLLQSKTVKSLIEEYLMVIPKEYQDKHLNKTIQK